MGILRNQRHERFCQEFAQGKTATEAMELAGIKDARNSTRLTKSDEIRRRIDELQAPAVEKAEITIASLIEEADRLLQGAEGKEQYSAAIAGLKLKSIYAGLYVEKQEAKVETTEHVIERQPNAADWQPKHSAEEDSRLAAAVGPSARSH